MENDGGSQIFRDLILRTPFGGDRSQPRWLWEIRRLNYHRFNDAGFPTRRDENWRFVNLETVLKTPYIASACVPLQPSGENSLRKFFVPNEKHRVVFMNGNYSEQFSYVKGLPRGVRVNELGGLLGRKTSTLRDYLAKDHAAETNPFAWINTFHFKSGVFIHVPRKVALREPIHLLFAGFTESETATVSYPRIVVALDAGASAEIIIEYAGLDGGERLTDAVCEVYLGKKARLAVAGLAREDRNSFLFMTSRFRLSESSRLETVSFARGGAGVCEDTRVDFEGTAGSCSLGGLSVLSGQSHTHRRITVSHRAPGCISRQYFKSILDDQSQSELNSLVHVLRGASGSDSNQLDRNLLLSDSARGFSRPQLKIDTDDVRATHGSATGQLIAEELFYLRSRGLNERLARFVLIFGFAEEILDRVPVASAREGLKPFVRGELESMLARKDESGGKPC